MLDMPKGRIKMKMGNVIVTLISAVSLLAVVVLPQWMMKTARWDILLSHIADDANHVASVIDGDLQGKLLDPANYTDELYQRALKPLVRFHSSDPNIVYVYTMMDRGGVAYFVLDTATSPELRTARKLEPSKYMEKFELRPEYEDGWLKQIAAGKTYVTPTFQTDQYGTFISGHAPIYDSKHNYVGFVGIDYDTDYYNKEEGEFTRIGYYSVFGAIMLAFFIGLSTHLLAK